MSDGLGAVTPTSRVLANADAIDEYIAAADTAGNPCEVIAVRDDHGSLFLVFWGSEDLIYQGVPMGNEEDTAIEDDRRAPVWRPESTGPVYPLTVLGMGRL